MLMNPAFYRRKTGQILRRINEPGAMASGSRPHRTDIELMIPFYITLHSLASVGDRVGGRRHARGFRDLRTPGRTTLTAGVAARRRPQPYHRLDDLNCVCYDPTYSTKWRLQDVACGEYGAATT
jgi:pyruvate dehydrogenase complex dehydrogenase (E1) component